MLHFFDSKVGETISTPVVGASMREAEPLDPVEIRSLWTADFKHICPARPT